MLNADSYNRKNLVIRTPSGRVHFDDITVVGDVVSYEIDAEKINRINGWYYCEVDGIHAPIDDEGAPVAVRPLWVWEVDVETNPPISTDYDDPPPTNDAKDEYATGEETLFNLIPPAGRTIRPGSVSIALYLGSQLIGTYTGRTDVFGTTIGQVGTVTVKYWGFYEDSVNGFTDEFTFESVPAFEITQRHRVTVLEPNQTIYGTAGSFFDLHIKPRAGAVLNPVFAVMGGDAQSINYDSISKGWIARLQWVTTTPQQVYVTVYVEGLAAPQTQYLYLTAYQEPQGQYADVRDGQSLDLNTPVNWQVGLPDPERTLLDIITGVYDADTGQARTSGSYGDTGSVAGVNLNSGPLPYGNWVLRTQYIYSDGTVTIERFFAIPEPSDEPFESAVFLYPTAIYTDGTVTVAYYTDHLSMAVRRWISINNVEFDLDKGGGQQAIVLRPGVHFTVAGTYNVQIGAEFSDTDPTTALSTIKSFTVADIPVQTLIEPILTNPESNSALQIILDSPIATPRQKSIAQSLMDFNNEITNEWTGTEWEAQAKADRSIYVSEQQSKPLDQWETFDEWLQSQTNFNDPEEYQQVLGTIMSAPTDNVNSLIGYWNQYFAFGSMEYRIQTGLGYFINQELKKGVLPETILEAYKRYQNDIWTTGFIFSFQDWVFHGPPTKNT